MRDQSYEQVPQSQQPYQPQPYQQPQQPYQPYQPQSIQQQSIPPYQLQQPQPQPQTQPQDYIYTPINTFDKEYIIRKNDGQLDFLHGFNECYPIELSQHSNIINQASYSQLISNLNSICKQNQETLKRNFIICLILFIVSFFFFFPFGLILDFIMFVMIFSFLFRIDGQMEVFISNYNSANISSGLKLEYIKGVYKRNVKIIFTNSSNINNNNNNINNNYINPNTNFVNNNNNSDNNSLYIIQSPSTNESSKDESKINLVD